MCPYPDEVSAPPRGVATGEYSEMLAQMEQIVRQALARTRHWKLPPGYTADYWNEERESIARIAVWNAYVYYDPDAGTPLSLYALYSAVQAIRREHRLVWRWCVHTVCSVDEEGGGKGIELADPHSKNAFERCEREVDIDRALQALSEDERCVILWWCRDGLTERQIAARLRLSKTAVHKRLQRAKSKLRNFLGIDS